MSRDQAVGATILVGCLLGTGTYLWLLFLSPWAILTLQLTALLAVGGILGIGAWIGYIMATTPPPKSIEELGTEPGGEEKMAETAEEGKTD